MKRNSIVVLVLAVLLFQEIKAQSNYIDGYVLISEIDTLYGKIDDKDCYNNSQFCDFKGVNTDSVIRYYPHKIYGYRFTNGKYYVAKEIGVDKKQVCLFMEYLVNGKLDVYLFQDKEQVNHYYASKDTLSLKELKYTKETINDEGNWEIEAEIYYSCMDSMKNLSEPINTENLVNHYSSNLEVSYNYLLPQNYNIKIIAIDDKMDSTIQSFPIVVDCKETSLNGIKESMFKVSENEFLILTLNLHTYQETQQNEKFKAIIDMIGKMDIDFIAFQECAQKKSSTIKEGIIRKDNMAMLISNGLKQKYNADYSYAWNWAHYGWDVWEEGVAVLSKHPLIDSEARYISTSTSTNNITSRKAIYGSYRTPKGIVHVFSAHTHWRTSFADEEQNNQVEKIKDMVIEKENSDPRILSFVCGDFNSNPTSDYPWSEGYNTMIGDTGFMDTFLEINPLANNRPAQSIYNTVEGEFPGRIDYIFMKNNVYYKVIDSQIIFKNNIIGQVSDHYGVITKIKYLQ